MRQLKFLLRRCLTEKKRYLLYAGAVVLCTAVCLLLLVPVFHGRTYTAQELGIATLYSPADANHNGIDDYTDLMLGARLDALAKPVYDGRYWEGGYPPDNMGVCTDVIWRAFKNAGYDLKAMVDADIAADPNAYYRVEVPDPNIDFRRVPNLRVFFGKYAQRLTNDPAKVEEFQPGDLIIYGDTHIAVVSSLRCRDGTPYILHNGGKFDREENGLCRREITDHFRFDASKIDAAVLRFWAEQ